MFLGVVRSSNVQEGGKSVGLTLRASLVCSTRYIVLVSWTVRRTVMEGRNGEWRLKTVSFASVDSQMGVCCTGIWCCRRVCSTFHYYARFAHHRNVGGTEALCFVPNITWYQPSKLVSAGCPCHNILAIVNRSGL